MDARKQANLMHRVAEDWQDSHDEELELEFEDRPFFRSVPEFERMLARSGIRLVKYWFSITDEEQHLRFLGRIHDPLKQWKLSPMDLESRRRWEEYTKAKEVMLERTHIAEAPWWWCRRWTRRRRA
jgi:polyphosphate kinase